MAAPQELIRARYNALPALIMETLVGDIMHLREFEHRLDRDNWPNAASRNAQAVTARMVITDCPAQACAALREQAAHAWAQISDPDGQVTSQPARPMPSM